MKKRTVLIIIDFAAAIIAALMLACAVFCVFDWYTAQPHDIAALGCSVLFVLAAVWMMGLADAAERRIH